MMVLKSPKGIYMQLESGKIIAIRTALKVGHNKDKTSPETTFMAREMQKRNAPIKPSNTLNVSASSTNATETSTFSTNSKSNTVSTPSRSRGANHVHFGRNTSATANKNVQMVTAKPYNSKPNARNMAASDTSSLLQGQYSASNSNSSFEADISDDSQFLEKLGENLANQQNSQDDSKSMNKINEMKRSESTIQSISNEPIHSYQEDKSKNESVNEIPRHDNEKPGNAQHSQAQNKSEHMNSHQQNSNNDNYNISNGANVNFMPQQNYNYHYTSANNGSYNDSQNSQSNQPQQHTMHQTNAMSSQQSEKYRTMAQHVRH